jgi:hypothetical protein
MPGLTVIVRLKAHQFSTPVGHQCLRSRGIVPAFVLLFVLASGAITAPKDPNDLSTPRVDSNVRATQYATCAATHIRDRDVFHLIEPYGVLSIRTSRDPSQNSKGLASVGRSASGKASSLLA